MRVGMNCRVLSTPEPTGTARYTRQLLAAALDVTDDRAGPSFSLYEVETVPDGIEAGGRVDRGIVPHRRRPRRRWGPSIRAASAG